ncbi:sensor histidine kinase [Streptomyces massasporeus]
MLLIAQSGSLGSLIHQVWPIASTAGLPGVNVLGWMTAWVWWPAFGALPLALLLYPTGRLPSPRWNRIRLFFLSLIIVPTIALGVVGAIHPTAGVVDPEDIEQSPLFPVNRSSFVALQVCLLIALVSLITRWRKGSRLERDQLKWLAFAVSLAIAGQVALDHVAYSPVVLQGISFCLDAGVPAAVAVAVLRYRLWAIDVIIRRSLSYAGLTAIVVVLYAGVMWSVNSVLHREATFAASVLATGVVAVSLQPLHQRSQRAVNRVFFGDRDEPHTVIARLTDRLRTSVEPDAALPMVARTVADALRLQYVAVETKKGPRVNHGSPTETVLTLPLQYRNAVIGRLLVSPRLPGDDLSSADKDLLDQVAGLAAMAVEAARLTADLRDSRERVVRAREEERRRLRRDLHDGVGPALVGLRLQLAAAEHLAQGSAEHLRERLQALETQVDGIAADVSQAVVGLRPAALDDEGLIEAVRLYANRLVTPDGVRITVKVEGSASELPAAVDAAAYLIATEAMTNVVRHASATECKVLVRVCDLLELIVADNGKGLPAQRRRGVGLTSMHERAEELGGKLLLEPTPGHGLTVVARLPLGSSG